MKYITLLFLFFSFSTLSQKIDWKELSTDVLAQAQAENKIVMLNLKANWCHWCHVMDDSTYANTVAQSHIVTMFEE